MSSSILGLGSPCVPKDGCLQAGLAWNRWHTRWQEGPASPGRGAESQEVVTYCLQSPSRNSIMRRALVFLLIPLHWFAGPHAQAPPSMRIISQRAGGLAGRCVRGPHGVSRGITGALVSPVYWSRCPLEAHQAALLSLGGTAPATPSGRATWSTKCAPSLPPGLQTLGTGHPWDSDLE